jgi:hypothetical protein
LFVKCIIAKKKFGKICKAKQPIIENKGIFCGRKSPNPAKARHARVLQGFIPGPVGRDLESALGVLAGLVPAKTSRLLWAMTAP